MTDFDIGDLVQVTGEFRNASGALTDPTDLELKVKPPAADAVTYTYNPGPIVKDSTGIYHYDLSPDAAGSWGYRWTSTGVAQAAEPGQFYVRPEFFALLRPTADDVAALLRARTKDSNGVELGEFTDDTRPTRAQVDSLIDHATRTVLAAIPIDAPPVEYGDAVRALGAVRAAMLVELSYFPEEVSGEASAYTELKQLYDDALAGVGGLLRNQDPAVSGLASVPIRSSVLTAAEWVDPEPPPVTA